ncbi:hypothetical protein, partial [Novosphingobium pentaromativorans]|uniref:hypothetical protein n=1 Tax=Novosphingobium pentaromativorans TaxID=205844 RepID=UPI000586C53E
SYLAGSGASSIEPNIERVDVRYVDKKGRHILVEIKPCDLATVRFAIRAAIGQLLDYHQKHAGDPELLIVVDCKPHADDLALAIDNGFGTAWRNGSGFDLIWPKQPKPKHKSKRE